MKRLAIALLLLALASPAWGAIVVEGSITGSAGNGNDCVVTTPGVVGNNWVLYFFWMKDDDPLPTVAPLNNGGTWVSLESNADTTGADRASGIYRMIVTDFANVDSSYTVSGDKEAWVCMIVSLSGVDTTTPEDVTQTYLLENATTAPTATGLTPANNASGPNIWVFSGCDVAATTFTVPSGFTEEETLASTGIDTSLGYKANNWKSTEGDADFTLGVSGDCQSYMLALRDASPPTPPAGRSRRMF